MTSSAIFDDSDALAEELMAVIRVPLYENSLRIRTSFTACTLSLEHWTSTKFLLRTDLFQSAIVIHRAQFEAITRSIWLLYAASDKQLSKLSADLSLETEQNAKNLPSVAGMMQGLSRKAPPQAYDALSRFKKNSWHALNSYVHAGIHPIRRHEDGYPPTLLHQVLGNTNSLAVLSCMQIAVLAGQHKLQRVVLDVAAKHPACLSPPM